MSKVIKSSEKQTDSIARYERETLTERVPVVVEDAPEEEEVDQAPDPAEVLAEAHAEAERVVRDAYAEGLRRGIEAGQAQYLESVGQSAEALQAAAGAMKAAREEFISSLEPQVVALVKDIARRILQREIQAKGDLVCRTVRSALANLAEREQVTIRLNPADAETLQREKVALLEEFEAVKRMEIVTDDSVSPGGCIAESELLQVDARLDAQLERILEAMTE
jgi:flagellar assembly protein FliH